MKIYYTLVIVLSLLVVPLTTRTVSAQVLEGVYTVEGVNPGNNKTYRGVVEIQTVDTVDHTPRVETVHLVHTTYLCKWTLGKTPAGEWIEAYGYGFRNGNQFVVGIVTPAGDSLTVASYDLVNGTLSGRWSVAGSGVISTETLTPSGKDAEVLKESLPSPEAREL